MTVMQVLPSFAAGALILLSQPVQNQQPHLSDHRTDAAWLKERFRRSMNQVFTNDPRNSTINRARGHISANHCINVG